MSFVSLCRTKLFVEDFIWGHSQSERSLSGRLDTDSRHFRRAGKHWDRSMSVITMMSEQTLKPMGVDAVLRILATDFEKLARSRRFPWTQFPAEIRHMIIRECLLLDWQERLERKEIEVTHNSRSAVLEDSNILVRQTKWTLTACPLFRTAYNLAWTSYDMAEDTFATLKLLYHELQDSPPPTPRVTTVCSREGERKRDLYRLRKSSDTVEVEAAFAHYCKSRSVKAALKYVSNMVRLPCHGRSCAVVCVEWRSDICRGEGAGCAKALEGLKIRLDERWLPSRCFELHELLYSPIAAGCSSRWWYGLPSRGLKEHGRLHNENLIAWTADDVVELITSIPKYVMEEREKALAKKKARKWVARPIPRQSLPVQSAAHEKVRPECHEARPSI